MSHLGWAGSFYALAAINLLLGAAIWRFLPAPRKLPTAKTGVCPHLHAGTADAAAGLDHGG